MPAKPAKSSAVGGFFIENIVTGVIGFLGAKLTPLICARIPNPLLGLACGAVLGAVLAGVGYILNTLVFKVKEFNPLELAAIALGGLIAGLGGTVGKIFPGAAGDWVRRQLTSLISSTINLVGQNLAKRGWMVAAGALMVVSATLASQAEPASCNASDPHDRKC